jgi:hypothetical protein
MNGGPRFSAILAGAAKPIEGGDLETISFWRTPPFSASV